MFTGDDLIDDVLNKRFGNGYAFYGERQSDQQKDYSAIAEEAKQIVAMREVRRALRAASPARLPGILQLPPPPARGPPIHPTADASSPMQVRQDATLVIGACRVLGGVAQWTTIKAMQKQVCT